MPNIKVLPDGKRIIDTGLPQRQIKPIWLELHKEMNQKLMDAIRTCAPSDGTVVRMIQFSISLILDQDIRKDINERAKQLIQEKTSNTELSHSEKMQIIEGIYIELNADVTDYIDTAFGVSHRIAIGIE